MSSTRGCSTLILHYRCHRPAAGKSTFAQQLASRLNLPNVLQTDILYEVRGFPGHAFGIFPDLRATAKPALHQLAPAKPYQAQAQGGRNMPAYKWRVAAHHSGAGVVPAPDSSAPACPPSGCASCCARASGARFPAPLCGAVRGWRMMSSSPSSKRSAASFGGAWMGTCARWACLHDWGHLGER